MKLKATLLCSAILLASMAFAGPGDAPSVSTDYIQIIDAVTGEPLIGVEVRTECSEQVLYTDPDGMIELPHRSDKSCDLALSYISYHEVQVSLSDLSADKQIALVSR